MLDYYREKEQRGSRVTVEADHIRVVDPSGFVWKHYDGRSEGYGPRTFVMTVQAQIKADPRPRPWWRWFF